MTKSKCVTIKISGRVQGVWFRKHAKDFADSLGLVGQAKNNPDGSVTIKTCGEISALKEMVEWSKKGSPMARVEKVDFDFSDDECENDNFVIL